MAFSSIDLRPHFVAARNLHDISVVLKGLRSGVLEFPADKVEKLSDSTQYEEKVIKENGGRTMINGTSPAEPHVKTESSTSFALPASYIPSLPLQDHGIFPDLYATVDKENFRLTTRYKMKESMKINTHEKDGQKQQTAALSSSSSPVEQTEEMKATSHLEHCKGREDSLHNDSFRQHLEQFTMNGGLEQEKEYNSISNDKKTDEHVSQEQHSAHSILSNEIQEHQPTQVLPQLSSMLHDLQPNKIKLRNNTQQHINKNTNTQVKMLCIWDIDDTLVGSGSAGIRQHPVFKYEELKRVFKSVSGPNTRHLLLSQGSIDDILADDGSSKLGYLREFFDVQYRTENNFVNKAKSNKTNVTSHKDNNKKVHVLCHGSNNNNNVKSSRTVNRNEKEKVDKKEFLESRSEVQENCDGVVEQSSCSKATRKVASRENSIESERRSESWFTSLFTCKSVEQRSKPPSAYSRSTKSTSLSSSINITDKNNHTLTSSSSSQSSTLVHISENTYLIQLSAIRHNAFYEFDSERLYSYLHNPPSEESAPHYNFINSSINMTQSTAANSTHVEGDNSINNSNHVASNNNSSINDDYSRWLILRPEIWGITLSSLSTPIAPTEHTAFIDGRRFRKMDVVWSFAKSGNWDVVFFVDNSLCETGVTRTGANLMDLLRYRHGNHMRNFYKAEYILLAASAKLRQMEQRLHRDVTKPLSGYERCHAQYFHRARMGSFVSANITPSDIVTPAFHTANVQEQEQEQKQENLKEGSLHNTSSTIITENESTTKKESKISNRNNEKGNVSVNTCNVNGVMPHDAPLPENHYQEEEKEKEECSRSNTAECKAGEGLLPPVLLLQPQTIDVSEVGDIASQRSISFTVEVMEYNTKCNGESIDYSKLTGSACNSDINNKPTKANSNKLKKTFSNPLQEEEEEEEEWKEEDELEEEERQHEKVSLQNGNKLGCTTKKYNDSQEMGSETESSNEMTDEYDFLCGASKPVDLVIVNFHMPSASYRTILHGCRTMTVVTTVTSQHHGSRKGSKQIMNHPTFSRYVGQPVFTSNVGCTDEQYSAVMKIFWAQLNALYQLLEEDLRVNGFVDLGRREKWRPRTSTVHFREPVPVRTLHFLSHYYQSVCDEIEQRLITPLLSGREEVQEKLYDICSIAFELYEKLLYGVVFTDPVLTQHVALNLFQIYTSEKRIPSSLVRELRENVHRLLYISSNNKYNNNINNHSVNSKQ